MSTLTAYKTLLVFTALLLSINSIGQNQLNQKKFLLLQHGLPDPDPHVHNFIAAKWGIEFRLVAGCMISKELKDSIAQENKKVEALIEAKFGKKWHEEFAKQVQEEEKREQKVRTMLYGIDYIQQKEAELRKDGNGLAYTIAPAPNAKKYFVSVRGRGKWNGKDAYWTYYKLMVDYEAASVQVLSSQVTEE